MIKNVIRYVTLAVCLGSLVACAKSPAGSATSEAVKLENEEQKTLYALGLFLGQRVQPFELSAEELAFVKAGMTDSATGAKPQVEFNTYSPLITELHDKRLAGKAEGNKKKGQEFADSVGKEANATKTESGIVIRTIKPGSGGNPAETDVVKVHYEGKLIDGSVFDSSIQKEPIEFPLNGVVPCWREAVQKMKKGEKSQIVCPSSLAYGDAGQPPDIPPGATLSFEVELLDFHKP